MGEAANRRWDIKHGGLLRVAVLLLDLWVWRRVMGRETFEEWLISGGGGGGWGGTTTAWEEGGKYCWNCYMSFSPYGG